MKIKTNEDEEILLNHLQILPYLHMDILLVTRYKTMMMGDIFKGQKNIFIGFFSSNSQMTYFFSYQGLL